MTTLVTIHLTCPVCGEHFASQRIASTNSVGQDTDFRPHTVGEDPQPHYVHVCPECLFAAFEGDYNQVEDGVRRMVLEGEHNPEQFADELASDALSGSAKYLLAARCYSRDSRASDLRLADLHLRASWCARQEGRTDRERAAQLDAVLLFEQALAQGEVAEDQLPTILYLIGEIYRRIGRFELAVAMFDQALEVAGAASEARFVSLTKRQRAAALAGRSGNMQIDSD